MQHFTPPVRYRQNACGWSLIIGVFNNSVSEIASLSFESVCLILHYTEFMKDKKKTKLSLVRNLLSSLCLSLSRSDHVSSRSVPFLHPLTLMLFPPTSQTFICISLDPSITPFYTSNTT